MINMTTVTRIGAARTMEALDFECSGLSREFHATADAVNAGLPFPALRDSFAELAKIAARIANIANAQVELFDDALKLEAAE